MALKKVIYFDKPGALYTPETDDDQAKPNVYGVRWVNPDTFETIRVRGGARTGDHAAGAQRGEEHDDHDQRRAKRPGPRRAPGWRGRRRARRASPGEGTHQFVSGYEPGSVGASDGYGACGACCPQAGG